MFNSGCMVIKVCILFCKKENYFTTEFQKCVMCVLLLIFMSTIILAYIDQDNYSDSLPDMHLILRSFITS